MKTRTIYPSAAWQGLYSRFSFDPLKQQLLLLKEVGKPVLDDEFAWLQDALHTRLRTAIEDVAGAGALESGFLVVADGADNDFAIQAGAFYLNGIRLENPQNLRYASQSPTPPPLTTPTANRVDCVYLDAWLDEVGPDQDPSMIDPTLNQETSRRLQVFWQVRVREGQGSPPDDGLDADGLLHVHTRLALLNRPANVALITSRQDKRDRFGSKGGAGQALIGEYRSFAYVPEASTGWLLRDGRELDREAFSDLFARIGTTYGQGNGTSTFNLPDSCKRFGMGFGAGYPLGGKGGAETHTLTVDELPEHEHKQDQHDRASADGNVGRAANDDGAILAAFNTSLGKNTGKTGKGAAFSILPPYDVEAKCLYAGPQAFDYSGTGTGAVGGDSGSGGGSGGNDSDQPLQFTDNPSDTSWDATADTNGATTRVEQTSTRPATVVGGVPPYTFFVVQQSGDSSWSATPATGDGIASGQTVPITYFSSCDPDTQIDKHATYQQTFTDASGQSLSRMVGGVHRYTDSDTGNSGGGTDGTGGTGSGTGGGGGGGGGGDGGNTQIN
jgi:microcystin-dependent protein